MSLEPHLAAWLAAIKTKGSLPIEQSDGSGRDASIPEKVARRLYERALIEPTFDRKAWTLTQRGLLIVAGQREAAR